MLFVIFSKVTVVTTCVTIIIPVKRSHQPDILPTSAGIIFSYLLPPFPDIKATGILQNTLMRLTLKITNLLAHRKKKTIVCI